MTTDTAVLVSHEILEGKHLFSDLTFVTDPEVPNGEDVKNFVDVNCDLGKLASEVYPKEAIRLANLDVPLFDKTFKGVVVKKQEGGDVEVEETTIM
jgi:hypothetical protein